VSDSLFDRRMLCLRQRRAELAATVTVLQQTTAETVAQVVDTAAGLPPIAACEDDERLSNGPLAARDPSGRRAVEAGARAASRVQALERSGRYQEALDELAPLQREAEALGDLTLRAEVLLRLAGKLAATPTTTTRRSSRSRRPRRSRSSPAATGRGGGAHRVDLQRRLRRGPQRGGASPRRRARGPWSAASAARRPRRPAAQQPRGGPLRDRRLRRQHRRVRQALAVLTSARPTIRSASRSSTTS
jgi:hypothetical protein